MNFVIERYSVNASVSVFHLPVYHVSRYCPFKPFFLLTTTSSALFYSLRFALCSLALLGDERQRPRLLSSADDYSRAHSIDLQRASVEKTILPFLIAFSTLLSSKESLAPILHRIPRNCHSTVSVANAIKQLFC